MEIRSEADFNALEDEWWGLLLGRSLVVEADIEPSLAIKALEILGQNLATKRDETRARLFQRYPSILAVGLCAVGATQYNAGAFWPNVPIEFRLDMDRQRETGKAFQQAIKRLSLSRFTTPYKYVGEILMHAGVPIPSVGDLVRTILRWDDGHTSGDAIGFIRWVSSMSQRVATTRGFNVPTYRFLTEGGEIAEDFVERVISAIDAGGRSPDLPTAIAEAIDEALEGVTDRGHRKSRRAVDNIPTLTYDQHHGVRLQLPPLEAEIDAALTWTVLAGGEVQRIQVDAPWPGDPIEPKWAAVRAPQQTVAVTVTPGDQRWDLPLINSSDPLLIFDGETGVLIPERTSLPKGIVWLAFPGEGSQQPDSLLEVDGELIVTEQGGTPHGWSGWAFLAIDASKLKKLRLAAVKDRWRYVTRVNRPRLVTEIDPIPFLTTTDGHDVFSSRSELLLPGPNESSGHVDWVVTITDHTGAEISRNSHRIVESSTQVELWPEAESLLGQFTVMVRGPLGRGATLRVAVAEEFSANASTPYRWITQQGSGLEEATITIIRVFEHSTVVINLDRLQRTGSASLRSGVQTLNVVGEIPHLAVGFADKNSDGEKIVPLFVDIEGLPHATVRVRVPPGSRHVYASALHRREILQTLEAKGRWGSPTRTFDLAALSGTLSQRPAAELRLVIDDSSAPIAFIRPRSLANYLDVDASGALEITGKADIAGLVAYVYPEFARWREPYRIEIPEGISKVSLPSEVRREGRAVVVLTANNPWVREMPPKRPDRFSPNAFSVKVGTLVDTDDPSERGFRRWLAGMAPCPSHVDALPIALQLYSLLKLEESPEIADRMRTALAEAVRPHRKLLLTSVLQSNADLDDLMRLLVEADVVTVAREDWESLDDIWALAPGLGVLADTDELGTDGEPRFRAHIESSIGQEGLAILDTGQDPALTVGRFNEQTNILLRMSEEQLEDLIRAAAIVPKALLDRDSRTTASFQVLEARNSLAIKKLRELSAQLLEFSKQALLADYGKESVEPVLAREVPESKSGLGNIPAVSLALALVARAAARSKPQSVRLYSFVREGFAKLAAEAPKIVHQDLALAELWITRWEDIN